MATVNTEKVVTNSNIVTKPSETFMFSKQNYIYMAGGLALIALGFILMSGGKSADPHVFNADEIYSFRRITLAPILIVIGFMAEIFAIMWMPNENK
jgi:Protein of unknown function (DUF3098)